MDRLLDENISPDFRENLNTKQTIEAMNTTIDSTNANCAIHIDTHIHSHIVCLSPLPVGAVIPMLAHSKHSKPFCTAVPEAADLIVGTPSSLTCCLELTAASATAVPESPIDFGASTLSYFNQEFKITLVLPAKQNPCNICSYGEFNKYPTATGVAHAHCATV